MRDFACVYADGHSDVTVNQPWTFTVKEGQVRCVAHIINLAVQDAPKTLKAESEQDANRHRVKFDQAHAARLPARSDGVPYAPAKLWKHILVYKNRRACRIAPERHINANGPPATKLALDMSVRMSSTHHMLQVAIKAPTSIAAHCATQKLDSSMRALQLNEEDMDILEQIERVFTIFVRPTIRIQADKYPILNSAVPQYPNMMQELKMMKTDAGTSKQSEKPVPLLISS